MKEKLKREKGLDEAQRAKEVRLEPRERIKAAGSFFFGFVIGYMATMVGRRSVVLFVSLIVGTLGGVSLLSYFKAGVNLGWFGVGLFVGFVTNQIISLILFGTEGIIVYDWRGIERELSPFI